MNNLEKQGGLIKMVSTGKQRLMKKNIKKTKGDVLNEL